jgi:hypothetical protein
METIMKVLLEFDPDDPNDVRRVREYFVRICGPQEEQLPVEDGALVEILNLGCGELLKLAHEHFGAGQFTLVTLSEVTGREVASLHSLTANLGRACAQRSVEVFDRHGGQPLVLSLKPEVIRVLTQRGAREE